MEDDDILLNNTEDAEQLEFQNFMLSSAEEDLLAGKIPQSSSSNQAQISYLTQVRISYEFLRHRLMLSIGFRS